MGVGVAVGSGVGEAVGVGVAVDSGVGVRVGVAVGSGVGEAVGAGVGVIVGSAVAVDVGAGVDARATTEVGVAPDWSPHASPIMVNKIVSAKARYSLMSLYSALPSSTHSINDILVTAW